MEQPGLEAMVKEAQDWGDGAHILALPFIGCVVWGKFFLNLSGSQFPLL